MSVSKNVCCKNLLEGLLFHESEETLDHLRSAMDIADEERKKVLEKLENFIENAPNLKIAGGTTWKVFYSGIIPEELLKDYSELAKKQENLYLLMSESTTEDSQLELVEVENGILVKTN